MRIGVTGAFGFLGASFVRALLDEGRPGLEIVAFASRTRTNPLFDPAAVRVESLDVLDRRGLAERFSGLDAVAHFAGKVGFRASERKAVWDANVIGAKNVFDAVLETGIGRLLNVSSINVLRGAAPGALATESSAPYRASMAGPRGQAPKHRSPDSFASSEDALAAVEASVAGDYSFLRRVRVAYGDSKLAAWELAKRYFIDKALPVVTIFPGTAVGPGDLHDSISKLVDQVWEGRLRLVIEGSTSFVDSRDFAEGAVLALDRGRPGEGYILAGRDEDCMSYAEFMGIVRGAAGREGGPGPLVLPRALALVAASIAEFVAPSGDLTKAHVLSGSEINRCSSAKAVAELGYRPVVPLVESALACRRFSEARLSVRA
jgi:dihydroflavonol-4-reductase